MTVREVIALLKAAVPEMPKDGMLDGSSDHLAFGNPDTKVNGVVTTFSATAEVVERAAELGANLILTHEATFYHWEDSLTTFADDTVIAAKVKQLESYNIAVFRYHDYWHMHEPDGIYVGVTEQLGWQKYLVAGTQHVFELPPISLVELAQSLKKMLDVKNVQVMGAEDRLYRRVGLFVGSPPGNWHIASRTQDGLELLICGEIGETDLAEYVRDANYYGQNLGLIVVGHQPSEEAGMAYLARWLQPQLPDVPVTHIASGFPLRMI